MQELKIKTGSVRSTIQQLESAFNITPSDDNKLLINNNLVKIDYQWFTPFQGIEIGLHKVAFKEDFKIEIIDGNEKEKYIYFQFDYSNNIAPKSTEEASKLLSTSTNLMSMQSTNIPLEMKANKGDISEWVSVRVSEDHFNNYMSHMKKHIGKVFDIDNPWIIYDIIPTNVQILIDELFSVNDEMTPPRKNSIILSRTAEIIGTFLDMIIRRNQGDVQNNNMHIEDIRRMHSIKGELTQLMDKTPSLNSLAEKYGVSLSKLKRDFESAFGTTIPRFHLNYRLELSYKMLSQKNISVTEVSRHFGFKSISNFSENFKDKFQATPKEIASLHQKN
ncbi:AraC family transcriptional regulator [Flammeovirga sp. SubArs3]|uniref:helix-turn-helix transcriptional regulator n=1 Tax=Flammeovirga sp. SubArs3 TaxID=2995316 RepID=UPI00248CFB81|nr:AraC family transcriptional regulator [Flammeovirga sp. SubArs3]